MNGVPKLVRLDDPLTVLKFIIHRSNHYLLQVPPIADLLSALDDLPVKERARESDSFRLTSAFAFLATSLIDPPKAPAHPNRQGLVAGSSLTFYTATGWPFIL